MTSPRRCPVVEIRAADRSTVRARRDHLILENLALVNAIARKMHPQYRHLVELDDMIQAGRIGLLRAATRYRRELGVPFDAYARPRIRGAMLDLVKRQKLAASIEDIIEPAIAPADMAESIDRNRLLELIRSVELSPVQRAILDAYFSEHSPSLRIVAGEQGLTERSAWLQKRRALGILRAELGSVA